MNRFLSLMFTREDSNVGRQPELDITKTICIFFMVILHFFEEFASESTEVYGSFANILTYFLAGFTGAGTFMLCMGIGFGYTRHSEAKDFIKRGALILLFSYILNFVRAFSGIFFLFPRADFPGDGFEIIVNCLLNVDIMQFAGLTLMVFGLFKLAKLKPWMMLTIAMALSLAGTFIIIFVGPFATGNYILDGFLSLFIPIWYGESGYFISFFPFICYFIFPIAGYCSSFYYKKLKNKKIFFGIALGLAVLAIAIYCLVNPPRLERGMFRPYDVGYYHMYTWDACINVITSTGLIGLTYFISLILPKFILSGCHNISKNINKIYCISWVITLNSIHIYFISLLCKGKPFPEGVNNWIGLLIGVGIFIISSLIAHYYVKVKQIIKDKKKPKEVPNP